MVSDATFRPIIWSLRFGGFLQLIPADWDQERFRVKINYGYELKIPGTGFRIYSRLVTPHVFLIGVNSVILYLLVFLKFCKHSSVDVYLSLVLLPGCLALEIL